MGRTSLERYNAAIPHLPPPTLLLKSDGKKRVLQVIAHWSCDISGKNTKTDYHITSQFAKITCFLQKQLLGCCFAIRRMFPVTEANFSSDLPWFFVSCLFMLWTKYMALFWGRKLSKRSPCELTILKHILVRGDFYFIFFSAQNEWSAQAQEAWANTNTSRISKISANGSFLLVHLFLELCLEGWLLESS